MTNFCKLKMITIKQTFGSFFLFIMILFFNGSNAASIQLLPEYTAKYSIKVGPVEIGRATRSLEKLTNGKYRFISDSKSTGLVSWFVKPRVVQTSIFSYENGNIKLASYHFVNEKKLNVVQHYDWKTLTVVSKRNEEILEYDIPAVTYDQNVYQLAIMLDLGNNVRNQVYHIAENKRLKTYDIKYLGSKKINTIYGKLEVERVRHEDKRGMTTLWFAKRLKYLPVRIDHKEKGVSFSAYLDELSGISLE